MWGCFTSFSSITSRTAVVLSPSVSCTNRKTACDMRRRSPRGRGEGGVGGWFSTQQLAAKWLAEHNSPSTSPKLSYAPPADLAQMTPAERACRSSLPDECVIINAEVTHHAYSSMPKLPCQA